MCNVCKMGYSNLPKDNLIDLCSTANKSGTPITDIFYWYSEYRSTKIKGMPLVGKGVAFFRDQLGGWRQCGLGMSPECPAIDGKAMDLPTQSAEEMKQSIENDPKLKKVDKGFLFLIPKLLQHIDKVEEREQCHVDQN